MKYRRAQTEGGTYFFTLVTHHRRRFLCKPENVTYLREAFRYVMVRHPFKSAFTRACGEVHRGAISASRRQKGEQAVWQRRFWEHQIRDERDLIQHVEYIHYNPVKHSLAKAPKDWEYSSFHRYVREGFYDKEWGAEGTISFEIGVGSE
jgi:putative transposase